MGICTISLVPSITSDILCMFMCVCTCVCGYVCVIMCVHMCVLMCVEDRDIFYQLFFTLSFEIGSLTNPGAHLFG